MAEFNPEYVKNLPDTYCKAEDSNNYKILNTVQSIATQLRNDTEDVFNSLDVEQAIGKTLDLYGNMLGQARGLATDEQYRILIKSKINRNLTSGDLNSVIHATALMFGCKPSEIEIIETDKPATVKVTGLPYSIINYTGLSVNQTLQLFYGLVPAGITVESAEIKGTFEFATTDTEYDETKGFAISEQDQSIGGFLGEIYSSDNEHLLPI